MWSPCLQVIVKILLWRGPDTFTQTKTEGVIPLAISKFLSSPTLMRVVPDSYSTLCGSTMTNFLSLKKTKIK